ncbi:interferon-induced protein 44-like [Alosa pseudoharengus]|uniref:interferon-induced protein 44-like n=1 Tax=Alosa pseudoharengus TaxID=34774 RepID=UPI003F8BAA40
MVQNILLNLYRKTPIINEVRDLKIFNPEVKLLRILIHGPVGTGKSSFINSIDSIFQGRMAQGALAEASTYDGSFTTMFYPHKVKDGKGGFLPFVINDIMGLEDGSGGAHVDDLKMALEGHLKEGIPQVILLTKVDTACPEVCKDLRLIYRSKKIKEKMQECSNKLGVPMNCIFPVKNYDHEIDLDDNVDKLLLSALKNILNFANDHVAEHHDKNKKKEQEKTSSP